MKLKLLYILLLMHKEMLSIKQYIRLVLQDINLFNDNIDYIAADFSFYFWLVSWPQKHSFSSRYFS